jgi:hypothetical protein
MDESYDRRSKADCASGGTCVKDNYCDGKVCCEMPTGPGKWMTLSECTAAGGADGHPDGCP